MSQYYRNLGARWDLNIKDFEDIDQPSIWPSPTGVHRFAVIRANKITFPLGPFTVTTGIDTLSCESQQGDLTAGGTGYRGYKIYLELRLGEDVLYSERPKYPPGHPSIVQWSLEMRRWYHTPLRPNPLEAMNELLSIEAHKKQSCKKL